MEKEWVCIYITNNEYRAHLAKEMLADHDIESVIINKKDSSYGFGELEVYVMTDVVIRAKMLVNDFDH